MSEQSTWDRDWDPLGEDVTLHTMLGFFTHDDGRTCSYHSRLGVWATSDGERMTRRCLRVHTGVSDE